MEHARPPAELRLDGGPACRADAWRKWQRQFLIFLKASGVQKEQAGVEASLLINLIGSEGYDIYTTFKFTSEKDRDDVEKIIAKYDEHFKTKKNTTMLRFRFFTRNQEKGETIDDYVTALRILSHDCEFENLQDGLIRDRIVCGVIDCSVRDRLLRTDDLTLEKTVKICQVSEMSLEENRNIEVAKTSGSAGGETGGASSVDVLFGAGASRTRSSSSGGGGGGVRRGRGSSARGYARDYAAPTTTRMGRLCGACGYQCDGGSQCPARNVKCFICDKRGHYKRMCPVKTQRKVYELCEEDDYDDSLYYVSTIEEKLLSNKQNKWYEFLSLTSSGQRIKFKLDTGSDLNVLSKQTFMDLGYDEQMLQPSNVKAQSFCGNFIPILGKCVMSWSYKKQMYSLTFIITENDCQNILGKYACEELGIVKRILSLQINEYDDLFHGLGKLPGKYKITLEKNANPIVSPVRKIPIGVRDKLQSTLNQMVEMGVIRRVTHPTPWVNAIVLASKKNGDIRVCLDPRPLNRVIRRAHYPLPTVTDIAAKLEGARFFSKLDARSGFWMVEIDDESADLCTFGTPFGRYQYLRMPYGINSASEVFHAKVRQLLEDLEGVDSFVDDVIVWGKTAEEHDYRLRRLLDRARTVGIKFNKEKCQFRVEEVTYLGHTFSSRGMHIDKSKLRAIEEMPTPKDRGSLERLLGMVNYLSKFIPRYSQIVAPLRSLLKKNSQWVWDSTHDGVVARLKKALCSAPVLALYSTEEPVVLSVDASSAALGAVLLQAGRPVEFASLTLTDTQRRYAQIEKEMLAIVFALERFHQYVFGRNDVTIESDHKPLEAIFKKSLEAVPARLQRMMLRTQGYSFEVVYKPGKYMYIADALSRAALPELMHDKVSAEVEEATCFLIQNVRFSKDRLETVRQATAADGECKTIVKYITDGWPHNKSDVDIAARQLWAHREALEYVHGIIFKDNLVYIPADLRREMITKVHEGHQGIDRCKRHARDVMFWCGMSRDIERTVRHCPTCTEHAARPTREPLLMHEVPDLPWTKVGTDIFEYARKYYLVIVDYYSNYIEINKLPSMTSTAVICAMKEQFSRHGIPLEVISDNGPAYSSKEFRKFCSDWGLTHVTSSPNYAQSNGLSERAVRTVKHMLKKTSDAGTDFYLGLLNLRVTPRDGIGSPSQLLMGRRLGTRLPVHKEKLRPERDNTNDYKNILRNRERTKKYYDEHSRVLEDLQPGDEVIVTDPVNRKKMRVQSKTQQPRSYLLADSSNRIYRRNRRHLIKIEEVIVKSEMENEPNVPPETVSTDKETHSSGDNITPSQSVSAQEKQTAEECDSDNSVNSDEPGSDEDGDDVSPASTGTTGMDQDDDTDPQQGTLGRIYRAAKLKAQERIHGYYEKK